MSGKPVLRVWNLSSLVIGLLLGICDCVTSAYDRQVRCYACGLNSVNPNLDSPGSYGSKLYNHSCDDMKRSMDRGRISDKFIRTCPAGIRSCFGATGVYDQRDRDPRNDINIFYLGCSEAKFRHDFGCDREAQPINTKDMHGKNHQAKIDVKICFCSQKLCNHPDGDLFSSQAQPSSRSNAHLIMAIVTIILTLLPLDLRPRLS